MPMLEENRRPEAGTPVEAGAEPRQRRQMLVALAVLLVALVLVLVKERQLWFPSAPVAEQESAADSATQPPAKPVAQAQPEAPSAQLRAASKARHARSTAPAKVDEPAATSPIATTTRAVLPALQVEVVAGDQRRNLQPGNNAVKVDMQPNSPPSPAEASGTSAGGATGASPAVDATERVRLSASTAEVVSRPVEPNYPLLAKQMKVQGAVVLQALIGKDGNIQDLQVVSGPAILSSAAREAVKQWRFKPYRVNGRAREFTTQITVNFRLP